MVLEARLIVLHIVLYCPDIPQNTGNIGRLCAVGGARLHLIHPLGFVINDKNLKRAGMDYWKQLDVHEHADWPSFLKSPQAPKRLFLFSTHATNLFWDAAFADEDGLLFGRETAGAPEWLHASIPEAQRVKIPQPQAGLRSLNLATCAGIALYEGLRQLRNR